MVPERRHRARRPEGLAGRLVVVVLVAFGTVREGVGQAYILWQANGSQCYTGPCFGRAVASAGDLNGDGVPDLLVGNPGWDPPFSINSAVGRAQVLSGADATPLLTVNGSGNYDRFGFSVAPTGDLDGDGVPDYVVGGPQFPDSFFLFAPGYVRVHSGATGAVLLTLNGTNIADRFGWSVASAGDVDGDGIADLVVGAPRLQTLGPVGSAKVFSGATGALLYTFSTATFGQTLGAAVAGGSDLTGDGVPEILVGAPRIPHPALPPFQGEAQIYSGATGALVTTLLGATPGDLFGYAIAFSGDLNGDGVPEFAVGAPFGVAVQSQGTAVVAPGYVRVFSGSSGGALLTLSAGTTGAVPGDAYGKAVAGAGDQDMDGIPDLAVGSTGRVQVFSGSTGALLDEFVGSGVGASLANAGDVNGDGFPDVLAGAPFASAAFVLSHVGLPPSATPFGSGCPGSGGITPGLNLYGGFPTTAIGNPRFGAVVSEALGGATTILVLGFSFQSWNGAPLPLNLGPYGIPGCSLFVSADSFRLAVANGSGAGDGFALVPLAVPAIPALAGILLHLQAYVVDPGPAPFPGAMTRAVQLILL